MKPASPNRSRWANLHSADPILPKQEKRQYTKRKEEQPQEPVVLCRVLPPVFALIPDLLDTPVPRNYSPEQAIDMLVFKIKNRLLR